jgi:hypothetical protein
MTRTSIRSGTAIIAVLICGVALAGCSAGSGSTAGTPGPAGDAGPARPVGKPPVAPAAGGPAAAGQRDAAKASGGSGPIAEGAGSQQAGGSPNLAAGLGARLVRTADLQVRARDVPDAAARVRQLATAAGGYVADERTTSAPPQPGSVLSLRVPTDALDRVMQQATTTGVVLGQSRTTQDVSQEYVDTTSRVQSQRASVARVRALLNRATDIGQVVQIEGELARRQADLESLEAQLKQLQDRTALSTLTVSIGPVPAATPRPRTYGFVGGLTAGWHALTRSLAVLLTVLGALAPFAVLALALIGPVLIWSRRRRQAAASTSPGVS